MYSFGYVLDILLVFILDTQFVLDTLVLLQFGYVWIRGVSVFCWNNDVCA